MLVRTLIADPSTSPLWTWLYALGTNRPLDMDRDSRPDYNFTQVNDERRSGYGDLGTWPADLIAKDYPAGRARLATHHHDHPTP